jgi:hypothetical protein
MIRSWICGLVAAIARTRRARRVASEVDYDMRPYERLYHWGSVRAARRLEMSHRNQRRPAPVARRTSPAHGVQSPAEARGLVLLLDGVTDSSRNSPPVVRIRDDGNSTIDQSLGVEPGGLQRGSGVAPPPRTTSRLLAVCHSRSNPACSFASMAPGIRAYSWMVIGHSRGRFGRTRTSTRVT